MARRMAEFGHAWRGVVEACRLDSGYEFANYQVNRLSRKNQANLQTVPCRSVPEKRGCNLSIYAERCILWVVLSV